MPEFKYLFSPLRLGGVTIPNRISFSAHMTNFGLGNRISPQHVSYYRERAKGGAGLIITEELSIHPSDHPYPKLVFAFEPDVVEGYRELTAAVHEYPTKIFAQLNHNGSQGDGSLTGRPVWGPSPERDPLFREMAKEMEPEEIEECLRYFARSARYVVDGGFDGIEIQVGHSSLVRQFLSPASNQRTDQYGGSLDNRLRFCLEVLEAVRNEVGPDFTLGVRLNADEMHPAGGLTINDTPEIAARLEASGLIDFLDLSIGTFHNLYLVEGSMHTPLAYTVPLASAIRARVSLPVFATNRINDPHLADNILADGHADMIGMVRALICDPQLPNKAKRGNLDDIRYCIADNQGCIGRMGLGHSLGCIQNPCVGKEQEWGEGSLEPALQPKKVVVVGAGPAGLEASRVLALRGHQVLLLEKKQQVGGQNIIASLATGRQEIEGATRWLAGQCRKLANIELRLGHEATAESVLQERPDAVVIATGASPKPFPLPGEYEAPQVVNTWQVLTGEVEFQDADLLVVDMDGHHQATSVAEFLAEAGNRVKMVSASLFIGDKLGPLQDFQLARSRLAQKGVELLSDVAVFQIAENKAQAVHCYTGEMMEFADQTAIVVVASHQAQDQLYRELESKVAELYRIGDCLAPRKLDMAIFEGHRLGREL